MPAARRGLRLFAACAPALLGLLGCETQGRVGPPFPSVDKTSFTFTATVGGPQQFQDKFTLINNGGGEMRYAISSNKSWLSADPISGVVKKIPDEITVHANGAGVVAGLHTGVLTIQILNPDTIIPLLVVSVTLTVPTVTIFYVNDAVSNAADVFTTAPGSDLNDGASPATPKATIQAVLGSPQFGPGASIRVDSGTYTMSADLQLTSAHSGTAAQRVRITGAGANLTILHRTSTAAGTSAVSCIGLQEFVIEEITLRGGQRAAWLTTNCANITFDSVIFEQAGADGLLVADSSGILVAASTARDNAGNGLSFFNSTGCQVRNARVENSGVSGIFGSGSAGLIVRRTTVFGGTFGVLLDGCSSAIVSDSLVHSHLTSGIQLANGSTAATLVNNTLRDNGAQEIRFQGGGLGGSTDGQIWNCIVAPVGGAGVSVAADSLTGFTADYNDLFPSAGGIVGRWDVLDQADLAAWQAASGGDANSLSVDPAFVNVATDDLRILSTSPLIDQGTNTAPSLGALDLNGGPRIQGTSPATVDMGAHEFGTVLP